MLGALGVVFGVAVLPDTTAELDPATFTITGLADSTTYNIQLKAVNVAGAGAASSAVAATTWGVPAAPTIVSSTARDGALDVAFVSGANGGDSISNYEYSIDSGATWITRNPASIVSPLVISGLTNGTAYAVQLRAVNSVGAGTASATATLKPHAVPSAPATSVKPVGAVGTVRGATDVLHNEATPIPTLFTALTRNVYEVPFVSEVIDADVAADVPLINENHVLPPFVEYSTS